MHTKKKILRNSLATFLSNISLSILNAHVYWARVFLVYHTVPGVLMRVFSQLVSFSL